ncbi:hemolysin family protein [Brevibacterium jeotgali]|uniref:Hemolysin, contains CBS domains n=1 Tax=Brevibacterium jeotgali TaxID=1262550 RepID=A0A2H1L791_9MICO|nr:hemolysin family protein [Brevibacterium jeotgali]TWC03189.1 CBS domain containing-hemolysin-like protein [Brevibacterium jeotgali]SMY12752.1 Hemolysin, contains CBS domains [Brevibacterium jeotgali]
MEWFLLLLALLMIIGNGFFVAAEFSLLTLDKHTVDAAVAKKVPFSVTIQKATKQLSTQLSAAQVGITITALMTGYLMQPSVGALVSPLLVDLGLPQSLAAGVALGFALVVSTMLSMVIGELVPKNLAISSPMQAARIAVPFQYVFSIVFKPIIAVLNGTANRALISMGIEPQEEGAAGRSPEELTALVRHSADEGKMAEQTADLLERTLSFSQRTAEDVMTPRTRMVSVTKDSIAADIVDVARRTGYSRFPVVGESLDDIVGVVHIKSALSVPLDNRQDAYAGGLMTEVAQVPETLPLDRLLLRLRSRSTQMVVVVDEYGGTAGVATLEDAVEELVGEVADEHDRLRVTVRPARDGTWIVPGRLRPDEVTSIVGLEVPENADYETVAGFMMLELGRIPEDGDEARIDGARIVVERMHGRRVERLRIIPDYLVHDRLRGRAAVGSGSAPAGGGDGR